MKTRLTSLMLLLAFLPLGLLLASDVPPVKEAASQDLSAVLTEAQRLIKDGKLSEAVEVLSKGRGRAVALEQENILLTEEYLWQVATSLLDFANKLTNQDQYREYAKRARERWKGYITWFENLSDQDKPSLTSQNNRIMKATVHLGNSLIRMEQPRALFREFSEIPDVRFLSSEAFDLWKNWLYSCPEMETLPSEERTFEVRGRKICLESCTEDWRAYAENLSEWADADWDSSLIADPRTTVLNRRSRESSQILKAVAKCEEQ